ncbi:Nuclear protein localization protein 4 [Golovinomyces cichoracearum]|uniref:Nuclear protein localization protein 4 n=1 Tax=Golovinomyces cichoracearum TaxID=62708 RepID=A0A420I6M7_9PEZI|nr:Nuclear protein localization protein 4 [Golovinomyces cichoracearum]
MLLRCRGPDGMARIIIDREDTYEELELKLKKVLPDHVDYQSLTVSKKPAGGEVKYMKEISKFKVSEIGFEHGDIIFLNYKKIEDLSNQTSLKIDYKLAPSTNRLNGRPFLTDHKPDENMTAPLIGSIKYSKGSTAQSALDDRLDKQDGKILRTRDKKMCRHGDKGMCDYCMPLEPFNAEYLLEKNIKNLSFHSYLRKINSATNKPELGSSFMPPLSEPYYRVKSGCPSGHPQWPGGICTKCQPSAITLQPQPFRMVDHVEFSKPEIIDHLLNYWRMSGCQRFGYLYGRYTEYSEVPLGIKAVVEAIYEPPQADETDGITLNYWNNEESVDEVARLCGLEKVGVIWTDLLDSGKGDGTVVCKRHFDSYYLSSLEIVFSAHLQANYPKSTKWSDSGKFGSNFVTCVLSGDVSGQIAISAYQVSNLAVEMVRADIIEPSADPGIMLVRSECNEASEKAVRYIPEVFYKRINEYGRGIQENAKPSFPVEYLLVTLTYGFPSNPKPLFIAKAPTFPIENRSAIGIDQDLKAISSHFGLGKSSNRKDSSVSDFHLLCYLHDFSWLDKTEEALLCRVATQHDPMEEEQLKSTSGWNTLLAVLQSTGERPPKRPSPTDCDGSKSERLAKRIGEVRLG